MSKATNASAPTDPAYAVAAQLTPEQHYSMDLLCGMLCEICNNYAVAEAARQLEKSPTPPSADLLLAAISDFIKQKDATDLLDCTPVILAFVAAIITQL